MNIGDRVRIVDLHAYDAFYDDRAKLIGTEAVVTCTAGPNSGHADELNGYIALGVDGSDEAALALGRDKDYRDFFFFGVKVEPVTELHDGTVNDDYAQVELRVMAHISGKKES